MVCQFLRFPFLYLNTCTASPINAQSIPDARISSDTPANLCNLITLMIPIGRRVVRIGEHATIDNTTMIQSIQHNVRRLPWTRIRMRKVIKEQSFRSLIWRALVRVNDGEAWVGSDATAAMRTQDMVLWARSSGLAHFRGWKDIIGDFGLGPSVWFFGGDAGDFLGDALDVVERWRWLSRGERCCHEGCQRHWGSRYYSGLHCWSLDSQVMRWMYWVWTWRGFLLRETLCVERLIAEYCSRNIRARGQNDYLLDYHIDPLIMKCSWRLWEKSQKKTPTRSYAYALLYGRLHELRCGGLACALLLHAWWSDMAGVVRTLEWYDTSWSN